MCLCGLGFNKRIIFDITLFDTGKLQEMQVVKIEFNCLSTVALSQSANLWL